MLLLSGRVCCLLSAVLQRSHILVRWGWDEAWWSHAVGNASLVSAGFLREQRRAQIISPCSPQTMAVRLLCHCQGVPPLSIFLHSCSLPDSLHSSSFFLIHLCKIWWNSNVELEKKKKTTISAVVCYWKSSIVLLHHTTKPPQQISSCSYNLYIQIFFLLKSRNYTKCNNILVLIFFPSSFCLLCPVLSVLCHLAKTKRLLVWFH